MTLIPGDARSQAIPPAERICVFCGSEASADFILNVLLFMPLGWALRRWLPVWSIVGLAALLSMGIEGTQLFLAGRFTSVSDVLANGVGAGLGAAARVHPRRVAWLGSAFALACLLFPGWLLVPEPPEGRYWGQWTPEFGHMEHYGGEVLEVRMTGVPVPSWEARDPEPLREALRFGGRTEIRFVAGPPTRVESPIFAVADRAGDHMLMLGVRGEDVFVTLWRRGTTLGFRTPTWWWRGLGSAWSEGDQVDAELRIGEAGPCLVLNGGARCRPHAPWDAGWAVLGPGAYGAPVYHAFRWIWMVGWGLMLLSPALPWTRLYAFFD